MKVTSLLAPALTGFLSLSLLLAGSASAMMSPHPIQLYEKGMALLETYHGNESTINQSEKFFEQLTEKYPESPFGYLGMSQAQIIKAYKYGDVYDMADIRDNALPFAIKALELGSSLREVHEHYAVFERIFEQYYARQQRTQQSLLTAPDSAATFFDVAVFLHDQGEYEKALEYFKLSLDMNPSPAVRLKILKRIVLVYLNDLRQPEKALEYCREALTIGQDMPLLNEYMGKAYLDMQQYSLSIEKLKASLALIKLDIPEYYLLQAQGYLAEMEGQTDEAVKFLEQAAGRQSKDARLHYRLGNLYYTAANYEAAYVHFKKVIDLTPSGDKVYQPDAYYLAGRSAHSLGKEDLAIDCYRKYLQIDEASQEAEWIRKNIPDISHHLTSP